MVGQKAALKDYDSLSAAAKAEAKKRLLAMVRLMHVIDSGSSLGEALTIVAKERGISQVSLRRYAAAIKSMPMSDWLVLLAPRHGGGRQRAAVSAEAWAFIKSDYLRPSQPSFASCYERLKSQAALKGWTIPSYARLFLRLKKDIPRQARTLMRSGREATKTLYPAMQRDRRHMTALEAVNADGHRFDVFVRWLDGTISRPQMMAVQDVYSGKILGYRIAKTENSETIRLVFKDVFADFGIPQHAYLDNGRGFASKWITGGTANRYRFKVKAEEPIGILTACGVRVHWTLPYSGQSKPIERAFRDFCDAIAKHPSCEGAYTGGSTEKKPSNYASRAVDLAVFIRVVAAGIKAHNARNGRRSKVCAGKSFDEVFRASYQQRAISQATAAQLRMLMTAAECVTARKPSGVLHMLGNRYWSPFLVNHVGRKVVVRFDPEALHQAVAVYGLDGRFLNTAALLEAQGFDDVAAAKDHARKRNAWLRATRAVASLEQQMTPAQIAEMALQKDDQHSDKPQANVVRLLPHVGRLPQAALSSSEEEDDDGADGGDDVFFERIARGLGGTGER